MAAFETSTTLGPCPTDEELAAFLDDMLPKAERERITAHLADCESCYEIFVGVVQFQQDSPTTEQEGRVVLFPSNKDGDGGMRKRWWIPAAAAAVVALGVGFAGYRTFFPEPGVIMAAELVESFQDKPEAAQHLDPFKRSRGADKPEDLLSDRPSFLVGARLVDLLLGLRAGKGDQVAENLGQIGSQVKDGGGFFTDKAPSYFADAEKVRSKGVAALGPPDAAVRNLEKELNDTSSAPDFLAFGKWTEAGRLAAIIRAPDFFDRRNRRFLSSVERNFEKRKESRPLSKPDEFDDLAERDDRVLDELRQIAKIWDRGDLHADDYKKLAHHFTEIIQQYDV